MSNDRYIWQEQRQPGGMFTYEGRINRKRYIIYSVVLYFVGYLAGKAYLVDLTGAMSLVMMVFKVVVFALLALNIIKRLHDLLLPGWLGVVMVLTTFVVDVFAADILAFTKSAGTSRYLSDVIVLLSFFTICMQVYLALKKGVAGPNKYGADPLKK